MRTPVCFVAALLALAGSSLLQAEKDKKKPEPADNSRCFVCHGNYKKEKFALKHATKGIGCERCHGSCDAHCEDEEHLTPPDIMYAREKVPAACLGCQWFEPRGALSAAGGPPPRNLRRCAALEGAGPDIHGGGRSAVHAAQSTLPAKPLRRPAPGPGVLLRHPGADEARLHGAAELIALQPIARNGLMDQPQLSHREPVSQ